jgi:TPP-dependent pyruvate/acetoin dehydrogenase alpha subunit
MEKTGVWSKTYDHAVRSDAKDKVEEAVRETENMPPSDPRDMFRFMFHELTAELSEQMEGFLEGNGRQT